MAVGAAPAAGVEGGPREAVEETHDLVAQVAVGGPIGQGDAVGSPLEVPPGADLAGDDAGRRASAEPGEPAHAHFVEVAAGQPEVRPLVLVHKHAAVVVGRQRVVGGPAGIVPEHFETDMPRQVRIHVEKGQPRRELLLQILRAVGPRHGPFRSRVIVDIRIVPLVTILPVVGAHHHVVEGSGENADGHGGQFDRLARGQRDGGEIGDRGREDDRPRVGALDRQAPVAKVLERHEPAVIGACRRAGGRSRA